MRIMDNNEERLWWKWQLDRDYYTNYNRLIAGLKARGVEQALPLLQGQAPCTPDLFPLGSRQASSADLWHA